MNYGSNLPAEYPSSSGQSTLHNNDVNTHTVFDNPYPSNQNNHDKKTYQPPSYPQNSRQSIQGNQPIVPLNDVHEYEESIPTASSAARSITTNNTNGPMNKFSNHQQPSNGVDSISQPHPNETVIQTKNKKTSDEMQTKSTFKNQKQPITTRTQPVKDVNKKILTNEFNEDIPLVQSSNTDIWSNDTKKKSVVDEKSTKQTWAVKNDQLQMGQTQSDKTTRSKPFDNKSIGNKTKPIANSIKRDKTYDGQHDPSLDTLVDEDLFPKSFSNDHIRNSTIHQSMSKKHHLPSDKTTRSKPFDNKSIGNKTKPIANSIKRDKTYDGQHDPSLDTLVDEDLFPKSFSNDHIRNSTIHQSMSKKHHLPKTSSDPSSPTSSTKFPKHSQYELPSPKRIPPTYTTSSWRKQEGLDYQSDSNPFDYSPSELMQNDYYRKDPNERFREALQKLRADRAEQQKELSETTAKRLQYGDHIRHSTKDELLDSIIKPSPWSDFIELKKGNVLSLSNEEKRRFVKKGRSYSEKIRYRNADMWHASEEARSLQQNSSRKDDIHEFESSNFTPRQRTNNGISKSVNRTPKESDLISKIKSTNQIEMKQKDARDFNQMKTNQINRTFIRTDRSYAIGLSENDYENMSDRKSEQRNKKKKVHYAKYDSVGREISGIEKPYDRLDNLDQRNTRVKLGSINNSLYTLHEERPVEDTTNKKRWVYFQKANLT
ncbi:unnamed protein product [Adineta steineri]|uniref:Uncharacterized protein n=1 Tax=Adineta steineri TaxID=433720 RepID=A0A814V3M0_9BILA|nr:unnamed protein product [Adineta steineri]